MSDQTRNIATISYFPLYSKDRAHFEKYMKRHNKKILKKSELYKKLEELQYYNDMSARVWMKTLSELANKSKHKSLLDLGFKVVNDVKIHDSNGYAPMTVTNTGSLTVLGSNKPFINISEM